MRGMPGAVLRRRTRHERRIRRASLKPGGSCMPEVKPTSFFLVVLLDLRTASLTAAAIRSSEDFLVFLIRLSSRLMRLFTSWRPVITALTRSAPDCRSVGVGQLFLHLLHLFLHLLRLFHQAGRQLSSCSSPRMSTCCAPSAGQALVFQRSMVPSRTTARKATARATADQRVGIDRCLGCSAGARHAMALPWGRGPAQASQVTSSLRGAPQVLVQSIVQPPPLGGVEQRALARIEMQMPVVAVGSQRTVGSVLDVVRPPSRGNSSSHRGGLEAGPLPAAAPPPQNVRLGRGIQVGQGYPSNRLCVVVRGGGLIVLLALLWCYQTQPAGEVAQRKPQTNGT